MHLKFLIRIDGKCILVTRFDLIEIEKSLSNHLKRKVLYIKSIYLHTKINELIKKKNET